MTQTAPQLEAIDETFRRVFERLNPDKEAPRMFVHFYPYANLNSKIRLVPDYGWIEVKLSDQLESAPPEVHEALACILLSKLYRYPVPPKARQLYKDYVNRDEVRDQAIETKRRRGRKRIVHPSGEHYDLDEVFDEVNRRFFDGAIEKPHIGWSLHRAKSLLGHYDRAHGAIVISSIFDSEKIPRFLLEFVMYHEMLHIKHPVEYDGEKRSIHTAAFKRDERKFPRYREASAMLKRLGSLA